MLIELRMRQAQLFFFLKNPATTEISTLPLPAALPFYDRRHKRRMVVGDEAAADHAAASAGSRTACAGSGSSKDRKSTRLNSSHANISYAVFCLKKKTNIELAKYKLSAYNDIETALYSL